MLYQRESSPAPVRCNHACYSFINPAGFGGFTAIEFLLTLAAVSVLFISVVAGASQRNERLQVDEAARNLQLTMAFARNQAISRRSSVRVCPASDLLECSENGSWNKGWLVIDTDTEEVIRTIEPAAGEVQFLTDPGVSRYVQFNTLGDAYGTAGEFVVCHALQKDYSAGLRISAVGLVEHTENQSERCADQA